MDPSIVKLLEEDEDESMHSGADVAAFQAALNRDIEGTASDSPIPDPNTVSHGGSNHSSSQSFTHWQPHRNAENTNQHSQFSVESSQQKEQHLAAPDNQQQQNSLQEPKPLLHQKQSPNDPQQGQAFQNSKQVPQPTVMQNSEKNPLPTEPERFPNQDRESQYMKLQKMSSQQATSTDSPNTPGKFTNKQVPFAVLLPALIPQLDKDRAMQLHTLYSKLKNNEIAKEGFVRHMRDVVGDQMLRMAVNQLQMQMGSNPNQFQMSSQNSGRPNHPRMPSVGAGATKFTDPHSFAQLHPKTSSSPGDPSQVPSPAVKRADPSYPAQKSWDVEHQSDSRGILGGQMSSSNTVNSSAPTHSLSKPPPSQSHMQYPPPTSYHMYGNSSANYHPYAGANINTPASSLKSHAHDSPMRQITHSQNVGSASFGGSSQPMNMMGVPKFERQHPVNDQNRVQSASVSSLPTNPALQMHAASRQSLTSKEQNSGALSLMPYVKPESIDPNADQQQKSMSAGQAEQGNATPGNLRDDVLEKQSSRMGFQTSTMILSSSVSPSITSQLDATSVLSSRIPSVTSPAGVTARTPPKKPSIGQKKPIEISSSSPPPSGKKQKLSGTFSDQSIEQLNDVTAVSGVNLKEEEEQLFSVPKEDSRVSEASRKVVQEEEERLILQKIPLQKKLAEIMSRCGVKNLSSDVEKCLSLSVEERLRGLISNMIRVSKLRIDAEKPRHLTLITSDVRQQIMMVNQRAREELEKKQAEAEKLRKLNEPDGESGADGDKEKDEGRSKALKAVNKEEDDKMRTTAANVAARAAVGGDDMLSKWQLMAEQARQKREGGTDTPSSFQTGKDISRRSLSSSGRYLKDSQEGNKSGHSSLGSTSGAMRKNSRNQALAPQSLVARTLSVKDIIAVLEREPQMSKSTLIYRLYENVRPDLAPE